VQFRSSATTAPVDLPALVAALPALAARWRALKFESGVLTLDDGTRRPGLTLEAGTHPLPGTRYRVVAPSGDHESVDTWLVDLADDDSTRIRVRIANVDGRRQGQVELRHPLEPERVDATCVVDGAGGWLTQGTLTIDARVDLARLERARASHPQAEIVIRHRHLRGRTEIALEKSSPRRWTTTVLVSLRGAGVLRPAVALASPLLRRTVKKELDGITSALPARVDAFNKEMADRFGDPAPPDRIADGLLQDFLNELR
jgi:hypothetical protein